MELEFTTPNVIECKVISDHKFYTESNVNVKFQDVLEFSLDNLYISSDLTTIGLDCTLQPYEEN